MFSRTSSLLPQRGQLSLPLGASEAPTDFDEDERVEAMTRCVRGGILVKYGRRGKPHFSDVGISLDGKAVSWTSGAKSSMVGAQTKQQTNGKESGGPKMTRKVVASNGNWKTKDDEEKSNKKRFLELLIHPAPQGVVETVEHGRVDFDPHAIARIAIPPELIAHVHPAVLRNHPAKKFWRRA